MQIAVVLLLAVIVLAIVLVWVLQRGPLRLHPAPSTTTHLAPSHAAPHTLPTLDHHCRARHAATRFQSL